MRGSALMFLVCACATPAATVTTPHERKPEHPVVAPGPTRSEPTGTVGHAFAKYLASRSFQICRDAGSAYPVMLGALLVEIWDRASPTTLGAMTGYTVHNAMTCVDHDADSRAKDFTGQHLAIARDACSIHGFAGYELHDAEDAPVAIWREGDAIYFRSTVFVHCTGAR